MSHITPVGNRVLVRMSEPDATYSGGLVIPDSVQETPSTGTVEAVGTGNRLSAKLTFSIADQGVSVGDTVLLASAFVGAESGEDGVIIADMSEILAVL